VSAFRGLLDDRRRRALHAFGRSARPATRGHPHLHSIYTQHRTETDVRLTQLSLRDASLPSELDPNASRFRTECPKAI
jgi:hypothetical protein